MALTRKSLKAMGLTDEQVESIVEMHTETVDGLKGSLTKAQADAKTLPDVQKELDKALNDLKAAKDDGWKDKHDKVKKEFDEYKAGVAAKEAKAAKEAAAKAYYQSKHITGKALDIAMRGSGEEIAALELDENGSIKDAKALDALVAGTFAGLVEKTETIGAPTATPPANTGGSMTKADIYRKDDKGRYVMDATARQNALAKMMSENNTNMN